MNSRSKVTHLTDNGDPIPPWADRQVAGISEKVLTQVRATLFLANDDRALDRGLAACTCSRPAGSPPSGDALRVRRIPED